ncbi:MAG TPA: hypothetical protein VFB14_15035 [Bryobacteraceae bacterium]|nr:hypothetical protein [Bryobacteraceae bacterium]
MHFDTILNVVWLSLGLLAFASASRVAFRRGGGKDSARAWLHVVGVALIVAALFPYISATDDVLRIEHFDAQHTQQHSHKRGHNDDLMRLYETLDSPLLCRACEIVFTFTFILFVILPVARLVERSAPLAAGRSPPVPA